MQTTNPRAEIASGDIPPAGSGASSPENPVEAHLKSLQPNAIAALDAPLGRRIEVTFTDKFILYEDAKIALSILKSALDRPRCERPPGYALVAPSNGGKTALINRLNRDLGGDAAKRAGVHDRMRLLIVKLFARATEPRMALSVARAIGLPCAPGRMSREVSDIIVRELVAKDVKMVVFLEFDNVAPLPKPERQVVFDFVKGITNEGIIVVVVGTEETIELVREEEELVTRLRPLRLHGFARDAAFQSFLRTLETFYPLAQPSYLWRDYYQEIHRRTGGVLGEVVMLVNEAAAWAMRNGRTSIDAESLTQCAYIAPITTVRPAQP